MIVARTLVRTWLTEMSATLREPAGVMLDRWIATGVPPTDNRDGLLHARRPLSLPLSIMVVALAAGISTLQ